MTVEGAFKPATFLGKTCFVFTGANLDEKGDEYKKFLIKSAKDAGRSGVSKRTVDRWFEGSNPSSERSIFFFLQLLNDIRTSQKYEGFSDNRKKVWGIARRFCELTLEQIQDQQIAAGSGPEEHVNSGVDALKTADVIRRFGPASIRTAIILKSSIDLAGAVESLLSASGKNRLPDGLDALHSIPATLRNIARSADTKDWDALIEYIRMLEIENRQLKEELQKPTTKKRWEVFLDESAKTAGSWQAWAALGAAAWAAFGSFDLNFANELIGCFDDYAPNIAVPELPEVLDA